VITALQVPFAQVSLAPHVPHSPPHPSEPQLLPLQLGVHEGGGPCLTKPSIHAAQSSVRE
jgi:hypothetical protein